MSRATSTFALVLFLVAACRSDALLGNRPDARPDSAAIDLAPPPARFVVTAGGMGADAAHAIALDRDGNILVAGSFSGTARFGAHERVARHSADSFVAKLDPRGSFLWARRLGGLASGGLAAGNRPQGLAVDAQGYVYVATSFTGRAELDGTIVETANPTDLLIVKLDAAGRRIWHATAIRTHEIGLEEGLGIGVDAAGQSTVAGTFDHGAMIFGGISLDAEGDRATIFLTRLDADGHFQWAKPAGEPGEAIVAALAVDHAGNAYLAGTFGRYSGIGRFGARELKGEGGFVAKADPAGEFVWAKPVTTGAATGCRALALGPAGTIVATGSQKVDSVSRPYVVALTSSEGQLAWAQHHPLSGTFGHGGGRAIACGGDRCVVVGATVAGLSGITNGSLDTFVASLDAGGEILSSGSVLSSGDDVGHAIALDAAGNAYVAGSFSGEARFGDETVTAAGGTDAFVWKVPP